MAVQAKLTDNSPTFIGAMNSRVPVALEAVGLEAERYAKTEMPG